MKLRNIRTIHHDRRTLADEFNGKSVWVKYAVVPKRPFSSALYNLISRITNAPIFHSTHNPDPVSAMRAEAKRLRYMQDRGYLVPKILAEGERHMVLSDIGDSIDKAAAKTQSTAERRQFFAQAAQHLGNVHRDGEYHGRSRAKDMTIHDGKVGMIDLEHEPLKVMALPDAQARDLWFLFYDASRYLRKDPDLVPEMLHSYKENGPNGTFKHMADALKIMLPLSSSLRIACGGRSMNNIVCNVANMNDALATQLVAHKSAAIQSLKSGI